MVRTIDEIVSAVFSTSAGAPHLFGDRLSEFETELRALLAAAQPSAGYTDCVPETELRIWRRPEAH